MPVLGSLRALARLLHVLAYIAYGWLIIRLRFPHWTQQHRNARVQVWQRRMLEILGVQLRVSGEPPARGPVLLVANHISWLDILVMHAARHCRFVSKSEIRHWPLLGTLSTGSGTLYIEREKRRDAMRVVHHMAESLKDGDIVAVFPEGTTGNGRELLPFHANLIQAAISSGAPVQPVALRFLDPVTGAQSNRPQYLENDTLVGSVWRTLAGPPILAEVRYGEPQAADGRDRREWAADLRSSVETLLDGRVTQQLSG
jgi:1-acyl-sn-glycerol-3-phosphate acyltransferase